MTIDFHWRLPTHGEPSSHRHYEPYRGDWYFGKGTPKSTGLLTNDDLYNYADYLAEIARAAEISGFQGGLIPSFPETDEPWAISSFLARKTRTFRFMIAFQPGFLNPVTAARMTATLQRATNGRALFNVITGGGGPSQLWWGDSIDHDDRYTRTGEFLDVLRGVWNGGPFNYDGKFYTTRESGLQYPLTETNFPEIYFSGSSDAALNVASKHADYYLSWLEPLDQLKKKFDSVKSRTHALGRSVKCAVRVDIIARATEEEAWREVERGLSHISKETLEQFANRRGAGGDSVGAQRQHNIERSSTISSYKDLLISPNIWSGFSLFRGGQSNGIVGSYEQVAQRLDDLVQLGVDAFILAGTSHLEEAYRVGEEVLPLVRGHK
jgi:alkanesulfonate monooxygenase